VAVKDIRSQLGVLVAFIAQVIATDTTTTGAIIDTADNDLGLMFAIDCSDYTDGTYTMLIEESDDSGMSGSTVVAGDQLIGTLPVIAAALSEGDAMETVGVISTKRYVLPSLVSASTSTGATLSIIAIQKAELAPVA